MLPGLFNPQASAVPSGFIGAQTFTSDQGNLDFALNIPGALGGDLIVIYFGFDTGFDSAWSWDTPSLAWQSPAVVDATGGVLSTLASYTNYAIWDGVSFIKTTGVDPTSWKALSGVIAAFRGNTAFEERSGALGTGMPNGPSIGTGYGLYITCGMLDDDAVTMTAPSGWELAGAVTHTFDGATSSVAMAYNYDGLNDPDAFGGAGNDDWLADTIGFN